MSNITAKYSISNIQHGISNVQHNSQILNFQYPGLPGRPILPEILKAGQATGAPGYCLMLFTVNCIFRFIFAYFVCFVDKT